MAINLNDNLIVQAPKATDERYGPYANEAEALTAIEPIVRYQGLTAGVYISGQLTEYWFRDGILDTDFVEKTAVGPTTGVVGDIGFACSDEDTDLTTGLKFTFRVPYSMTISGVIISTNTAPTGSDLIVDIKLEDTTIFSVLPVIVAGQEVGGYDATLATTYLPVNAEITVFIDQVGSANAGTGLKVWLLGTKTACDLPPYFCNTHVNSGCVVDFSFAWKYCSSISTSPTVDTSSGTNFSRAWAGCTSLTTFPLLDVSNGTDFGYAWYNCTSLTTFPLLDVSNGTNFSLAWYGCNSLTSFPLLDVSSGTDFGNAWVSCTSLTSFPQLDVSSGTDFNYAWQNCTSLTSFPLLDVSNGTNFGAAWAGCNSLTSFPLLDVSNGTNFGAAWAGCNSLTSFPLLDTSSGTNFFGAWQNCNSLTSFPLLDVSSGTDFQQAWQNCTSLTSFPTNMFDSCLATDFPNAWQNCALDQTSVDNILVSLDTAGQSNGTVNIDGGTSAAPSVTGLAAKASLQGKGWTVTVNSPPPCDLPPYGCNTNVNPYCVTNFTNAWQNCTSLTSFPQLDVSSGTNFESTWQNCTSLTSFPAGMFDICTATNFTNTWFNCALDQTSVDNILVSLDTAGQSNGIINIGGGTSAAPGAIGLAAKASLEGKGWTVTVNSPPPCDQPPYNCNTSVNPYCVTDFTQAWYNCVSITSFPLLNVSNGFVFQQTWTNCNSLTSFPLLDTSSGTNFVATWQNCTSLTSFPLLDVSNGVNFANAWYGCTSLTSFPANMFDSCLAIQFTNAWANCALDQTSVDNILVSLDTAGRNNGTADFNGGTSSAPGALGVAAKASLISRGWTVTTN